MIPEIEHSYCEGKLVHVFYMVYVIAEYLNNSVEDPEVIFQV